MPSVFLSPSTQEFNPYINGGNVSEIPIPINDGKDVSYPVNTDIAMDYFYNIPANKRKFECQLGKDGYGFVQTSTSRLQPQ